MEDADAAQGVSGPGLVFDDSEAFWTARAALVGSAKELLSEWLWTHFLDPLPTAGEGHWCIALAESREDASVSVHGSALPVGRSFGAGVLIMPLCSFFALRSAIWLFRWQEGRG